MCWIHDESFSLILAREPKALVTEIWKAQTFSFSEQIFINHRYVRGHDGGHGCSSDQREFFLQRAPVYGEEESA